MLTDEMLADLHEALTDEKCVLTKGRWWVTYDDESLSRPMPDYRNSWDAFIWLWKKLSKEQQEQWAVIMIDDHLEATNEIQPILDLLSIGTNMQTPLEAMCKVVLSSKDMG